MFSSGTICKQSYLNKIQISDDYMSFFIYRLSQHNSGKHPVLFRDSFSKLLLSPVLFYHQHYEAFYFSGFTYIHLCIAPASRGCWEDRVHECKAHRIVPRTRWALHKFCCYHYCYLFYCFNLIEECRMSILLHPQLWLDARPAGKLLAP